jgi:hypothetical protein
VHAGILRLAKSLPKHLYEMYGQDFNQAMSDCQQAREHSKRTRCSQRSDLDFPKSHPVRQGVYYVKNWATAEPLEHYAVLSLCCLDEQGMAANLAYQPLVDEIMNQHYIPTCPHPLEWQPELERSLYSEAQLHALFQRNEGRIEPVLGCAHWEENKLYRFCHSAINPAIFALLSRTDLNAIETTANKQKYLASTDVLANVENLRSVSLQCPVKLSSDSCTFRILLEEAGLTASLHAGMALYVKTRGSAPGYVPFHALFEQAFKAAKC